MVGGLYKFVSMIGFGMVVLVRDSFMDELNGEVFFKLGVVFEIIFGWCVVCILFLWVDCILIKLVWIYGRF